MTHIEQLQHCAAENFMLYYSAHVAHVNVTGRNFYSDHKLFGKIYEDLQSSIDDFAEQQRELEQYMTLNLSTLIDQCDCFDGWASEMSAMAYIDELYERLETHIQHVSELYNLAEQEQEFGLSAFAQERLVNLKRHCYMLRSALQSSMPVFEIGDID